MANMQSTQSTTSRKYQDTYIYIDVSNIRSACLKTLGFMIDFVKLLEYFQRKYPNLRDVRYYEGCAKGDMKKRRVFNFLKRQGYTICPLERKAYNSLEIEEQTVKCPKCKHRWTAEFKREHKILKSNVDVYLSSDMMAQAARADHPTRLILVSCDGDYTEAIKNAIDLNKNVSVTVLATPTAKDMNKNTLSVRLKSLLTELPKSKYSLNYIDSIKTTIASNKPQKWGRFGA